ncbi:hypothetical protein SAMN04488003_11389 [Loktanella fryxellensis]|uniref:Uncharacterized protein n=1 Tax=Loktanella fryxellensis TaxID=245187 RepID=A0A1H8FQR3_9RHOB|nr:hypothetical protein [Loktanella fryxellensis]SEN33587.1 hypothetical protein SAMN04488003_11389 [Loktanella fryxellensis]
MAPDPRKPGSASGSGLTGSDLTALGVAAAWVVIVVLLMLLLPAAPDGFGGLQWLVLGMALIVPLGLIWMAAALTRTRDAVAADQHHLLATIDALRTTLTAERKARANAPTVEAKLNEIAHTARQTEKTLATFATTRAGAAKSKVGIASAAMTPQDDQQTLALGTQDDDTAPPLSRGDFIRALNFPDTEKDVAGFDALRRALKDRTARQLVQAAQDVLTLLSQDGIYMDDLIPDRARPEVWRRFAGGERGRALAGLGGIRDRSSLALSAGRMREDTIFRDAAHHFLRLFDKTLVTFEPEATDEEIAALTDTRTARAFMLLGRVTGTFD